MQKHKQIEGNIKTNNCFYEVSPIPVKELKKLAKVYSRKALTSHAK